MLSLHRVAISYLSAAFIVLSILLATMSLTGCERKQKVLEVKTPGADVEVKRDPLTGGVEIEVEK